MACLDNSKINQYMKQLSFNTAMLAFMIFSLSACYQKNTIDLKIMSYNIRHGVGMDDVLNLSRSARVIGLNAPDLCGLQEIDKYCSRSNNIDQTEYLATYNSSIGTFGKFMNYQGGEYGMATLINRQLSSTKILSLPDGKNEPRSAIVHTVELDQGVAITFANVHFDWVDGEEGIVNRQLQAKALVEYVDSLGLPAIIIGDFNCTPDSPTMLYFEKQGFVFAEKGKDRLSFQGEKYVEIDHLVYRHSEDLQFRIKTVELLDKPIVSDHRPLVVDLEVSF